MSNRRLTLFLLPYAGAGATVYREWRDLLPEWIVPVAMHPPGRGIRLRRPLAHRWPDLMDPLLRDASAHLQHPFAIFGHSMGALMGLELARGIRSTYGRSPVWMGVSGCIAPSRRTPETKWLTCPAAELIRELERLDGTPSEVFESSDLLELLLPVLRADFHLCGTYPRSSGPPLNCSMLALGGTRDDLSRPPENLASWRHETTGGFRLEMIAGGHFFIETSRSEVMDLVTEELGRAFFMERSAHV